jgi:hypothetical protein
MSLKRVIASVLAAASVLASAAVAGANAPLPTPGSATTVAALVAASPKITKLPSVTVPPLSQAASDDTPSYYTMPAAGCASTSECVYGDTSSPTSLVLYGDSHAMMWLPALAPIALADKFKLVLLWHPGCPVADVPFSWSACKGYRTTALAEIKKLAPFAVLAGNRTTDIVGPGGTKITNAQWEAGMKATIVALESKVTKVALIGDISQMDSPVPGCLSINPTKIQKCAVYNPNPKYTNRFAPEKDAAKALKVLYVNPQPWLCAKTCSPVVGNMIVYSDQGHVTATYAEYLTTVWASALKSFL